MQIITSGQNFLDIDAYAGCIAYAELLQKQGIQAQAVSDAPLNESIPPMVRAWGAPLATSYQAQPDDTFTLIDVSDPRYFASFVNTKKVAMVVDHHPGFEQYWQERLGDHACIEVVGAACTQVYELWKTAGLLDSMSQTSARLLICGILDNTLNFGAEIASPRDTEAYHDLMSRADLPSDWPAQYFQECEQAILADLSAALRADTKVIEFKTFTAPVRIGQLVIWDAAAALRQPETLIQAMEDVEPYWFVNIISLSEGCNYFVCNNGAVKVWLSDLLAADFSGSIGRTPRMWLRKEIMHEDAATVEL